MNAPLATSVALARIELERGRLRSADVAMDQVADRLPKLCRAAGARLCGAVASNDRKLKDLAQSIRRDGANANRLEKLENLRRAVDRVVRESYALATGAVLRAEHLDGGACDVAERLIADLAALVDERLARPVVPADSEFLHRATDVVRRRLPDYGLWDLPVMAHELGHLVTDLKVYDAEYELRLGVDESLRGGWPGCSTAQGEELFCDVFATFALGPSYPCALLLHRLDPTAPADTADPNATHPPDAVRAMAVLEALRQLDACATSRCRPRRMATQLENIWAELSGRPTATAAGDLVSSVHATVDFLTGELSKLQYEWRPSLIQELAKAYESGTPVAGGLRYEIRDVLSAASLVRLEQLRTGAPEPAGLAEGGTRLIAGAVRIGAGDEW